MLTRAEWQSREAAHVARVAAWSGPLLERRRRGESHPVEDFVVTYYATSPGRLARWTPGLGVECEGRAALPAVTERAARRAAFVVALLDRSDARPARFGCFGLHEWAMVYRQPAHERRHAGVPLRLGEQGTDAVVERLGVDCTHHDAFRFFTPQARPLNPREPTADRRLEDEQRGCLHATMDLYRYAADLLPWVPSELVVDCLELAREVRALDMAASPYDLTAYGVAPVAIETAAGQRDYARRQADVTARAAPLRARLRDAAERVAVAAPQAPEAPRA